MLEKIINFENIKSKFSDLSDDLLNNKSVNAMNLTQAEKTYFSAFYKNPILYVCQDRMSARKVCEKINEFAGYEKAVVLPEREDVLIHRHTSNYDTVYERANALTKYLTDISDILVLPVDSLIQYLPKRDLFESLIINLEINSEVNLENLVKKLVDAGYTREEKVLHKGSFSLRGDILEIFVIGYDLPFRVSFFDDVVEEIKVFEPESMLSTKNVEKISIAPATDIILSKDEGFKSIERIYKTVDDYTRKRNEEIIEDITNILTLHSSSPSLIWLYPFIQDVLSNIFDYLKEDSLIIFDEPKSIIDKAKLIHQEHFSRVERLMKEGEVLSNHYDSLIKFEDIKKNFKNYTNLSFQIISGENPLNKTDLIYQFENKAVNSYYLDFKTLLRDLQVFMSQNVTVLICAGDLERAHNLKDNLSFENIGVTLKEDVTFNELSTITILPYYLSNGINFVSEKFVLIGTNDVFRNTKNRKSLRRKRSVFTLPEKGSYVVHEIHGIGRCEGIVSLKGRIAKKDYVLVTYKNNDKLYVPIDQLDMLERFSGSDSKPVLSKIGGKEFERIKNSVKKSVKKLAIDLLDIYSKREKAQGYKYPKDNDLQMQFEDSFPYNETSDQDEAINDIKNDMETGKVMDRLICGDVGYGKTEVALRGVMKTVLGGKQAAILAPTTILAEQHFSTALDRFKPLGVNCAILSRFVTNKDIKLTLQNLKKGEVDVIIATHRLLSKDVEFKDLGLLVLDEEQRFGVEHKEKVKSLKSNINVLTLSATPIPRTLNMAMTGIRDISILETPPVGRLPVATYITEYTEALVVDSCTREINRGGQIIILYNKVATIEKFAHSIQRLLPHARIKIAHGQMGDKELEKVIEEIYDYKADILICTTIIENGVDLPLANTLIVCDADRLGLTELYQLRGRVGRRDRLAQAYFTFREGKVLTKDAFRRLEALAENTEFGSGFKIAMKDLEIRGAGNILGREQHGHMVKVGYEMYCKILDESVRELKGEEIKTLRDTEINISANAYLTDKEAGSQENKMRIYKRIADIRTVEDKEQVLVELNDILPKISKPLANLVDISLIRALSSNIGLIKVIVNDKKMDIVFEDLEHFKQENILKTIAEMHNDIIMNNDLQPRISFTYKNIDVREKMDRLISFLISCNGIIS